ncbi:hypothetical protein TBLA_0C02870 [Henningerozyma blattae CBS 6284]|uniref:Exocyst complex protein EXO70 n=1 Tax=Henningerozyma blattae (strain ATCC 34711 / CBS 6284 / DSM 70876 / NBRC 10599 / NRRL Y-10934 / UCD 77-7) TaxID=1071380 RepID=I2H140_HENB6|nr:hypothetical protein TBLA_0C02870 [Tetrapisispora blattae CBS 6284]CCH60092.1 hypothetical protein TBLA_0C02870 [Tetrapisispora blattae CBS 6284]
MIGDIDIDEADVIVLSRDLEKINKLSLQINKSLVQIADTTGQSGELFTPILSRNNMLATLQRNIESALNSVASVKDLANEASKHEIILSKGIGKVGLKAYIQAIHKLDDMLEDIKTSSKMDQKNSEFSGILTHLSSLIKSSENKLKSYFLAILSLIKPFDPQIYMDKKVPFPYFEDEHLLELTIILDYFFSSPEYPTIERILVQERSEMIMKSLSSLENFAKQIPASKGIKFAKGSSGMMNYSQALLGFVAIESTLVDDLFSQQADFRPLVFKSIIQPVLDGYSNLFDSNVTYVKNNLQDADVFSFELIDCVNNVIRQLRGTPLQDYTRLIMSAQNIQNVTQSIFKDVIEHIIITVNNMTTVPADNGVAEGTVDTMTRLRKLSEYQTGVLGAIQNMSRQDWLPSSYKEKEYTSQNININPKDTRSLLSCFLGDCIDTLIISLERRAQKILLPNQEPDIANPNSKRNTLKPKIGNFLISNLAMVGQIVEKSDLNSLLGMTGHSRLDKLQKRYINYIVSDWRDLTANLMDSVFVDNSGKISQSKDKEQIKEKFRKFNDGFEALVSNFKHYKITNEELKKVMRSEIISLVLPMYERFYSRYKNSFTHPRKHIRYTPTELTTILNQLGR